MDDDVSYIVIDYIVDDHIVNDCIVDDCIDDDNDDVVYIVVDDGSAVQYIAVDYISTAVDNIVVGCFILFLILSKEKPTLMR